MSEIIRHQHRQGLSQEFSARIAEDFFGRAIDEEHGALFIDGDDGVRGSIRDDAGNMVQAGQWSFEVVRSGIVHRNDRKLILFWIASQSECLEYRL